MNQSVNKYSFRQFLIPVDEQPLEKSRLRNKIIPPEVLHAIGDSSNTVLVLSFTQRIINFYKSLNICIRPQNKYLLVWQFLLMCVILFFALELGLLLAFTDQFWLDDLNNFLPAHVIFIFVLTTDILISPLKSYYDEGLLITDIGIIFRKYLSLEFWIDVIGLLVVIIPLITRSLQSNWIKILWLLKIYTVSKINIEFQRFTQLYISYNTAYLVLKLITFCYIYAHYMGIFFYMVSMWVYNNNYYGPNTPNLCWVYNSWAFYQMTLILTWQQMYIYIMYYSIAVVTTIAYGDITPKNPIQCVYTIVALIIVTLIFGYLMTEILRVLINVFSYNFDRRHLHYQFVSKLKNENIQQEIQVQIRAYTNEIDRQEQFRNRPTQEKIMNFLPPEPLYGLLFVIYQAFLKQLGFNLFKNSQLNFQVIHNKSLFLQRFMKDIKEERHYTGDLLYNQHDREDIKPEGHSVYYFTKKIYSSAVILGVGACPQLKNGKLDVTGNKNRNSFEVTKANDIFGQIQFFNGHKRSHWAFCVSNCVVFVANRQSLFTHYHLLTQDEKQIVFMNMEQASESCCLLCKQKHFFLKCPYSFVNASASLHQDKQVSRKNKILKVNRTRLKTLSSWAIYKNIKDTRVEITKQYRYKLLFNKADHSLFMEYELEQDNFDHEQEEYDMKLHETQVMIEKIYEQFIEQKGLVLESIEYDQVYNYEHYKPHNNIASLQSTINSLKPARLILNILQNYMN